MEWKRLCYHGDDLGDYYLVSDDGQIKGVMTGTIRRLTEISNGYFGCVISLGSRKKKMCIRIHRAVAEAFLPNPNGKPEINHKDGNKKNNHVSNLEWVDRSENMIHACSTGLLVNPVGSCHVNSRLTDEAVRWARNVYKPGDKEYGLRPLSKRLGVSHGTLYSAIRTGWKNVL